MGCGDSLEMPEDDGRAVLVAGGMSAYQGRVSLQALGLFLENGCI